MTARIATFIDLNQPLIVDQLSEAFLPEWDEFVHRHPWGLVYHLSGWKKAIEDSFPHIRGRVLVIRGANGEIVAGLPVYEVRSRFLGTRTVSIPFATLCDPLVTSEDQIKALVNHLKDSRETDSQPLRIGAWRAASIVTNGNSPDGIGFSHHFLVLDNSFDKLQQSFSKTAVRQMVARAQRRGVAVEACGVEDGLETFYNLYYGTRKRLGLPAMPFHFFGSLAHNLGSEKIELLFAKHGSDVLAGVLAFKWKNMVLVECLGEGVGARKVGANQLLWWEAIKDACDQGYGVFSFGRTHHANTGLMEFKRRWGTVEEHLCAFASPVLKMYTSDGAMTAALRRLTSVAPGPIYRLFSAACYRHLG